MKRLILLVLPVALWAQCTVTAPNNCPNSGSPTAGDLFGDTVKWTGIASVFSAPNMGDGAGQAFRSFTGGEGSAFGSIVANFSPYPSNAIQYSAEFWPLWQNYFLADPSSCPAAGAPTCLYNNVAYAEAAADALFKPLGQGGVGLQYTDINIDPSPWFMASQYSNYCAAYSSNTVARGKACFTPPTSPTNYKTILAQALGTYTTVLNYIRTTYPQVQIHFSPTPSSGVWNTCNLTVAANRTEAAVEACFGPLYQTMVANVSTARVTALHEAAGVWALYCGNCPLLASPANVDTFLQNTSKAIKAVSPSTKVGAGGAYSEMGISGGVYTCPNTGGSLNFWCDYTTVDASFLDFVGIDLYPSQDTSASFSSLVGTPSGATAGTYTYMAQRALAGHVPIYIDESSGMRWSFPVNTQGNADADTYFGSGWYGWNATNAWSGWLAAVPTAWAQSMSVVGWDYIDAPTLACQSTDPNNTHVCPNCNQTQTGTPVPDTFMATCMASLPSVSAFGTLYGTLASSATAGAGVPAAIAKSAGDGQSTPAGQAFPTALAVTVTDKTGAPVSGVSVTFTVTPGATGAGGAFSSSGTVLAATGQNGIATATVLTANSVPGQFTVMATVNALSATFTLANEGYTLGASAATVGSATGSSTVLLSGYGPWTAASNASWLDLAAGSASGGSGALIQFNYEANANPGVQTGTLTIAGLPFTVTQAGANYTPVYPVTALVSSGLSLPQAVAVDTQGNVYIADQGTNAITQWNAATGQVTALVDSGLNAPAGLAVDGQGNVYIADSGHNAIKQWIAATGQVTTRLTGLSGPQGLALDALGNLYIADTGNQTVQKWDAASQQVSVLVASGLNTPVAVAVDVQGNVYVADSGNNAVYEWPAGGSSLTTLVSGLNGPTGVAVDGQGNVYVADTGNNALKQWSAATQQVTALVSSGLNSPAGLAVDGAGNVYLADGGNSAVKELSLAYLALGALTSSESAAAGTDSIAAQVLPAGMALSATSDEPWLTTTGVAGGTLNFSFSANASAVARTGHITVLGPQVTVTQNGQASQTITFGGLSNQSFGSAPFTVSATASSGLAVSFASTTTAVCTMSNATVTLVAGGTCAIQATQAGNANYLAANPVTQSFQVTQASQTITFGGLSNQTYGSAPFTVSATATSGLPVNFLSTTSTVCTVSSGTVTIVAAGTCAIQATQAGNTNYAAANPVTQSFQVTQSSQTIAFGGLSNQTFGSAQFTVSATATSGLPVNFSSTTSTVCTVSGGTVTIVAAGTCAIQATQAGNTNYAAANPVMQSFQVTQASQTIAFGAPSNQTYGSAPFALSATATSGLAVSFSSTTQSVCSVSGATVTLAAAGTCTIQATQAGNANYQAANPVTQSFQINQASQTITFGAPSNQPYGSAPFALSATATSGLTVSFSSTTPSVCTVSGTTVTLAAAGTCTIQAAQAGNANYQAANPVTQSFQVNQGSQSISFGGLSNQPYGSAPFMVSATATSGLAVSFSSTTPSVCTVSGTAVTLAAAGTCTIQATQAGNANYQAANPVTQSFQVNQGSQSISFGGLSNQPYGSAPFALSATATSGLAVSFSSTTPSVCSVSGATVTLAAAGTCAIQANQAGNANYLAATAVTQSFQVTLASQTIAFGALSNQPYGSAPFMVSATASSGLAVSFSSTTPSVCTVSGTNVTLAAAGACTIQASQAGNSNYQAATAVTQSFQVTQASQAIVFGPLLNQPFGTAPFTVNAASTSGLAVSFASTTTAVCTVSGTTVTLVAVGQCSVQASQSGNTDYSPALSVVQSFQVMQPTTTAVSASTNPSVFGSLATLTATVSPASATGRVTFYDGTTVLGIAPVSNGVATFNATLLGAGSQSLTARYADWGGAVYAASISTPWMQTINAQPAASFNAATFAAGKNPQSLAMGDFNGDGNADLAIANAGDASVTVLLGNGSGGFTAASGSPFAVGANPYSVAVADFNGDGNTDLAIANAGDGTLTVLLGNGSGGFTAASGSPFAVGTNPYSVAVADFNGDGNADLAVANQGDGTVTVLLGNGSGGFTAASGSPFAVGTNPYSVAVADFNGDGNPDLAVANYGSGTVTVLLGDGSGGFAAASGSPFAVGTNPQSLAVGNFNGDGNADLAIVNGGDGTVTVLLGNGRGGFRAATGSPFAVGDNPSSVVAGDFNGNADLAVANAGDSTVTVLLGNGSGGFTPASGSPFTVGSGPISVAAGDFNGDGRTDLAVANSTGKNVTILLGADNAAQLQVTQQPAGGTAGSPIGSLVVEVQDAYGNLISGSTAAVTIASNPAGVSGTLTGNAVAGIATFSNLVFDVVNSYTLTASATGLTPTAGSSIQITPGSQSITFGTLSNQPFGTAPFTVSATATSGLAVSFASTTTAVCTVSGATVTLVAAGTCTVQATQAGNANYLAATAVNQSFQVTQATQTITFGSLSNQPFGTAPFTVSATATSGLAVSFASTTTAVCTVSGATVTLVAVGQCSIQATQAGNANYTAATPVTQSFQVTQAGQTVTFGTLSNQPFGTAPFAVSATATSGLAVSFASTTTAVCTVSGATVTLVAVGQCSIQATQAGNANYTAAPPVTQSFQVTQASQTITFGALSNRAYGSGTFTVSATASSGLAVSFASTTSTVCTLSGTTVTLVAVGKCSIQATQAGNTNYAAAPSVTQSFQVTQASQTITFAALSNRVYGSGTFTVSATATSGLAVSFASTTKTICTVSSATVTLVAAGQCSIQATQTGNTDYAAATPVTQSFQVTQATQTITFAALSNRVYGSGTFKVSATASSGLAVSFASTTTAICTVSSATVTLVAVGQCSIQATQAGNTDYAAATPVTQSFQVTQATQTITFGTLSNRVYASGTFKVSATASSGLAVSFASTTTTVCTLSGATVTLVAVGQCSIQATQAGNTNYAAATPVTQSFQVTQATQTITFGTLLNRVYGSGTFKVSATASSGLAVSFASTTTAVCTLSGATVTLVAVGQCSIQATQAGNTNYTAATPVTQSFQVTQASQTITFGTLASRALGTAPFTVSAKATSGLAVSFASTTTTICTVSGSTVTLVAVGQCSIQASQAGNANYLPATPVTQSFQVTAKK